MFEKINKIWYSKSMDEVDKQVIEKLNKLEEAYDEFSLLLEASEIITDNKLFIYYSAEKKKIESVAKEFKLYKGILKEIEENEELKCIEKDSSLKAKLLQENQVLTEQAKAKLNSIKIMLANGDSFNDQKAIIEISNKNGSEKVQEIIKSLELYASKNNIELKKEDLSTERINLYFSGLEIYEKLKAFSGKIKIVYRGNVSFASFAILNEDYEIISLRDEDIEVQTLKAGGAGGQHINKTESAIRVKHIPTGITAECEDERSQTANKAKAIENLKRKIMQKNQQSRDKNLNLQRKNLKNAVFSDTPSIIFDYDKNLVINCKNKKEYKLNSILNGELSLLFSEQNF